MRPIIVSALLMMASILLSQPSAAQESGDRPSIDDQQLAMQVLLEWEQLLQETDETTTPFASRQWRDYLDAWATLDLNQSVELERRHRGRGTLRLIVERLAAAERWDQLEKVIDESTTDLGFEPIQMWARVACYGAQLDDLSVVDLAGKRIERLAAEESASDDASPPRPSDRVCMGRFFVTAARLHVIRSDLEAIESRLLLGEASDELTQSQMQHQRQLRLASEDLWRAAGAVVPRNSVFSSAPSVEEMRGFAALESWTRDLVPRFISVRKPQQTGFVTALRERVQRFEDQPVAWSAEIALPSLDQPIARSWVHRQAHLGRLEAALAYLEVATGCDADRAMILAVSSRALTDRHETVAEDWRSAAFDALNEIETITPSTIRGWSELAISYGEADRIEVAQLCVERAIDQLTADPSIRRSNHHELLDVMIQALAIAHPNNRRASEILNRHGDRKIYQSSLSSFEFTVDGLRRSADWSHVIPGRMIRPRTHYTSHTRYNDLVLQRDWSGAIHEAADLATRNSAWRSSYLTIAVASVRDIGLEATLEWSRHLNDPSMRMAVEIAAVQEVIRANHRTLPTIDPARFDSVVPTIGWPSGC